MGYYDITALGDPFVNDSFSVEEQKKVVTRFMRRRSTMEIEWTPTRPGNWLFHCHLSFHVSNEIRLPGAVEMDDVDEHVHMAGLVLGIEVQPGPTDLVHKGEDRYLSLYANEYPAAERMRYAFSFSADERPDSLNHSTPGPP